MMKIDPLDIPMTQSNWICPACLWEGYSSLELCPRCEKSGIRNFERWSPILSQAGEATCWVDAEGFSWVCPDGMHEFWGVISEEFIHLVGSLEMSSQFKTIEARKAPTWGEWGDGDRCEAYADWLELFGSDVDSIFIRWEVAELPLRWKV